MTSMEIPALAFTVAVPGDGLPCLADWVTHSISIWATGYEGWRESVEIKPLCAQAGKPMEFGCLEAAKGKGRMSIILFAMAYTYLKLKNNLGDEELQEFGR